MSPQPARFRLGVSLGTARLWGRKLLLSMYIRTYLDLPRLGRLSIKSEPNPPDDLSQLNIGVIGYDNLQWSS